ncbi:helix-turn-helix transcriptional regulator [Bacillus marinisedimentorum]|uniref:helix-turn-helix transcriptional regulator n=1 Tax=Bacillus marinisedimentorum TaxID=1821260 RepID=UPI000871B991|nr:helix-turn-helix domain-containing protein [Bacillus marinisedimentorum]
MEQTLKVTSVLADPTRFSIYQYITRMHKEVTVQEIADSFNIHPNVARLHLSKLEDVSMLVSETKKTGKGGRPSRLYRLSDEVVQLNFPFRDYKLLASIAIDSLLSLGEEGQNALYQTGRRFGHEMVEQESKYRSNTNREEMTFEEKLALVKSASSMQGFYPEFEVIEDGSTIFFTVYNCPFKEVADSENGHPVCTMHHSFFYGIFEEVFKDEPVDLKQQERMTDGCAACTYKAVVTN